MPSCWRCYTTDGEQLSCLIWRDEAGRYETLARRDGSGWLKGNRTWRQTGRTVNAEKRGNESERLRERTTWLDTRHKVKRIKLDTGIGKGGDPLCSERVDGLGIKRYCDRLRVNVQLGGEEWNTSIVPAHKHSDGAAACAAEGWKSKAVILIIIIAVITACSHISQPLFPQCCFFSMLLCRLASNLFNLGLWQQAQLRRRLHKEEKNIPLALESQMDCCRKCNQKPWKGALTFNMWKWCQVDGFVGVCVCVCKL